jgi:hypothetical protein
MDISPLSSLADYRRFVSEWVNHPQIQHSTVIVWSESPHTGIAEGEIFFRNGLRLRMREDIDFDVFLSHPMVTRSTGVMSASIGTMIFRTPRIPALHQRFPITSMFRLI